MRQRPIVFISYNSGSSQKASELAEQLEDFAIVMRYETDVEDAGSFDEYMMTIKKADYVLSILSKSYLYSIPCMYEAAMISDMLDRVAFVVEDSATNLIYSVEGRLDIATYWVKEEERVRRRFNGLPDTTKAGFIRDVNRLEAIRNNVSIFLQKVADTKNTSSYKTVMTIKEKMKHFREDSRESDIRNAILSVIYDNTPKAEKIIYNAEAKGTIKRTDVEALTGDKKTAALKRINALVEAGVLVRVGGGRQTAYTVYTEDSIDVVKTLEAEE